MERHQDSKITKKFTATTWRSHLEFLKRFQRCTVKLTERKKRERSRSPERRSDRKNDFPCPSPKSVLVSISRIFHVQSSTPTPFLVIVIPPCFFNN
ncbi:uncharacterized protein CELE_E02H9.13 [Caenorhabditis elegans]|uniref:Uncharacterized protein n=1 Tax=Caenorhabditis elegans TaxID=6239 RepID=A0A679L8K1_CAEEL|nr:Uncharacterized protein CELE_E02H9.13 [Caenorhabditis elegans]CAA9991429.1 Uncharacterized protein CELE_E02H9.13 [Caenorhabditis elegans]